MTQYVLGSKSLKKKKKLSTSIIFDIKISSLIITTCYMIEIKMLASIIGSRITEKSWAVNKWKKTQRFFYYIAENLYFVTLVQEGLKCLFSRNY